MSRHFSYRLLPTLALVVSLVGCGTSARKPEPALAGAVPISAPATHIEAAPETSPASISADASTDSGQGLRPADSRLRLNLHVFGFSYHTDREGTRVSHLDNELNVGLGLNYEFHNDALGVTSLETGFFKDSGRNWAKFAGAGYQFKLGDRLKLGADLLAIHSPTYNNGRAFVAPIPRVTYDFGPVKLNAVYVPRYQELNRFAVFGFYFTVPMGTW
jgi:hypothetical protein